MTKEQTERFEKYLEDTLAHCRKRVVQHEEIEDRSYEDERWLTSKIEEIESEEKYLIEDFLKDNQIG